MSDSDPIQPGHDTALIYVNVGADFSAVIKNPTAQAIEFILSDEAQASIATGAAIKAFNSGDHDGARYFALKAYELQPEHPTHLAHYAAALIQDEKFDEAMDLCRRAIAIKPDYAPAVANLAECHFKKEDFAAAEPLLAQVVELAPHRKNVQWRYAQCLLLQDKHEQAATHLERATKIFPANLEMARLHYISVYKLSRMDAAEKTCISILEQAPDDLFANINMSNLLYLRGDIAGSLTYSQHAVEIDPNSAVAHSNYGEALLELGRIDEAREHLLKAQALNDGNEDVARTVQECMAKIQGNNGQDRRPGDF